MKMTEPTDETNASSVELGLSFGDKARTGDIVTALQDQLFRRNQEVGEFSLQLRAINELFTKGLPSDTWMLYQDLKDSYTIQLFENAPNYERIQEQFQNLIEEASKAPEPEVRDFIDYINELFIEYPNVVSIENDPSAPTIVKVDAYWNESPLESTSKDIPMQTVVYLSDGTIRPYVGDGSYIHIDHLPSHVKEAINEYDSYYYPESHV